MDKSETKYEKQAKELIKKGQATMAKCALLDHCVLLAASGKGLLADQMASFIDN